MTHDELVEKVGTVLLDAERKSMGLPYRASHTPADREYVKAQAKAAIATIREAIETLDANQEQIGFELAFDSFEMLNGEPFLQTDVAQRMFSAMLAASPLGEKSE